MSLPRDFRGKLYLVAALVGILAGLIGGAFHVLLDGAEEGRQVLRSALAGAPVPGWLILMALGPMVLIPAMWLVRRFAPETAGSGIQEVEAILAGHKYLNWRRVLPVKFVAGALAVGSGLVLGREGPTVHMGAALGKMASDWGRLDARQTKALISAGAAAGLAAAFNAPLAAIVFVTEELRDHFEYGFASLQSVILAACMAVVVSDSLLGQGPSLPVEHLHLVPLASLPLFLVLGVLVGAFGVAFNGLLLGSVRVFRQLREDHAYLVAGVVGAALGAVLWFAPQAAGGGEVLVEDLLRQPQALGFLVLLLAARTLTTVGSYGVGLPGGIFAPMLALGTIIGAGFDHLVPILTPGLGLEPGLFAVSAMGALFAATVRAPLTGIVLAIELTGAEDLALPLILTCLCATFTAQALGGRPVYGLLLEQAERSPRSLPRLGRRVLVAGLVLATLLGVDAHWPQAPDRVPSSELTTAAGLFAPPAPSRPEVRAPAVALEVLPGPVPDAHDAPILPIQRPEPATTELAAEPSSVVEPISPVDATLATPMEGQSEMGASTAESVPVPDAGLPAEPDAATSPVATAQQQELRPEQVRFAIQLISFRSEASLAPFVEKSHLAEPRTLPPEHRRGAWWPILIGDYATRDEAEAALGELPDRLRRLGPEVRVLPAGAETRRIP